MAPPGRASGFVGQPDWADIVFDSLYPLLYPVQFSLPRALPHTTITPPDEQQDDETTRGLRYLFFLDAVPGRTPTLLGDCTILALLCVAPGNGEKGRVFAGGRHNSVGGWLRAASLAIFIIAGGERSSRKDSFDAIEP